MKDLLKRLEDEILVCDGATGTMLIEKGLPTGSCPEYWGINNPSLLLSLHKAYIEAGADMIITNTFGANTIKLKKFNLEKKADDINKKAVEIAKKAANDKAYVLGDIGPIGEYLKPAGNIEPQEMQDVFMRQATTLKEAGVDAIILETMSDLEELKTAILTVKEVGKIPLIASMTFQKLQTKGFRTISGVSIPQFVDKTLLTGCDIIGSNCTLTIKEMVQLVSEMRNLSPSFLIAQPNAGMPKLIGGKTAYVQPIEEFSQYIKPLIKAGANIIGGCCGTTPGHIREIKKLISKMRNS